MASNPSNQYLNEPRRAPPSGNRRLLLGLLAGGGAILLLCCGIGGIGSVWFGITRFGASDGSGIGGDGKGSSATNVTEANFSKIKTGMNLEEVEAILGKGSATTRQGVYNLWQNKETMSNQVDRAISVSVTQWYLWTNGDLFLAVGLSPTRSRIDRVSVIVFRDARQALHALGDDPEVRR